MTDPITDFANRLGARISLDEKLVMKKETRYYLVNDNLKRLFRQDFFYAGIYLVKVKNDKFFPSFNLLRMLAEKKANKIVVDKKTEWLFICGRDIFKQGITKVPDSTKKGDYTLILDQCGECIGFGKILHTLDREKEGVVVKNISDIGDYLRREKHQF